MNIYRIILILEFMKRKCYFCSLLSPTSSDATFKKKKEREREIFEVYMNQVYLKYRHHFMDNKLYLFNFLSVIYIQFFLLAED
jgi:hypothetical protein